MKWLLDVIGVIAALLGALWILQGTNIVPVGFMSGHMQYAVLGVVAVIIGVGLIVVANRRQAGGTAGG